jgi:hypothetical protein
MNIYRYIDKEYFNKVLKAETRSDGYELSQDTITPNTSIIIYMKMPKNEKCYVSIFLVTEDEENLFNSWSSFYVKT